MWNQRFRMGQFCRTLLDPRVNAKSMWQEHVRGRPELTAVSHFKFHRGLFIKRRPFFFPIPIIMLQCSKFIPTKPARLSYIGDLPLLLLDSGRCRSGPSFVAQLFRNQKYMSVMRVKNSRRSTAGVAVRSRGR